VSSVKNLIVPVFITHRGCPHQCVFCNQEKITGLVHVPTLDEVREYLSKHLSHDTPHAVIAFYGGSFTGLPEPEQEGYLAAAGDFVARGFASGIRLSTRPDYMDTGKATFLKRHGVKVVELGVQSMDDAVLKASGRGHAGADVHRASGAIRAAGLELGIQLMAGLPTDTPEIFHDSVEAVISIRPDFVRIYPTLVVKNSPLETLWRRGEYVPLGLDEAVSLCADAVKRFRAEGIRVVRLGLQPSRELEDGLLAGPYHPAFGHLVDSLIALERMKAAINDAAPGLTEAVFVVNPSELSVYKGIKGENIEKLRACREGLSIAVRPDGMVEKGGLTHTFK